MPRVVGDKNHSLREQRLMAELEAQKAETLAVKAKLKAEKLRSKELAQRL
jgi:hypothetical protein